MKVLSTETNLSSATNVGSASVVRIFNSDSSAATVTKKDSGGSTIGTFTVGAGEVIYCEKNYTDTLEGGATLKVSKTAHSSMMSYSSYASYLGGGGGGGGGGGVQPSFTIAEHYYNQGSSPRGDDFTWNVTTGNGVNNFNNDTHTGSNETWGNIPVVTTPGKRLFVIIATWRDSTNAGDQWTEQFNPSDLNYELELKYGGVTKALTWRNVFSGTSFQATSIWTVFDDGAPSATDEYSIRFHAIDGNDHGNWSYSVIVLDDVNNIEYFNTEGLPFSGDNVNQTVSQALSLAPDNTTSATKVLRIAAGNGSNIPSNVLDYNKGGSEPVYTKIGEGDNGTNERHYHSYHFGDHGTQLNMIGTFGNGVEIAEDGISGIGAIIGLS